MGLNLCLHFGSNLHIWFSLEIEGGREMKPEWNVYSSVVREIHFLSLTFIIFLVQVFTDDNVQNSDFYI